MRSLVVASATVVALGCGTYGVDVSVDIVMDYVVGEEVDEIRVCVGSPPSDVLIPAPLECDEFSLVDSELNFTEPVRVAQFRGIASGQLLVSVHGLVGDRTVFSQAVLATVDSQDPTVFVPVGRLCFSSSCLSGCINGACVEDLCPGPTSPNTLAFANVPMCEALLCDDVSDCRTEDLPDCVDVTCSNGGCLTTLNHSECPESEVCRIDGCGSPGPDIPAIPGDDGPSSTAEPIQLRNAVGGLARRCGVRVTTSVGTLGAAPAPSQIFCWEDGGYAVQQDLGGLSINEETSASGSNLVAGEHHFCFITDTRQVACWGENDSGQAGPETGAEVTIPAVVYPDVVTEVVSLAAGKDFTCAASATEIWCWGDNSQRQLGGETSAGFCQPSDHLPSRDPPPPPGASSIRGLYAGSGGQHACALFQSDAYCWGRDDSGQVTGQPSASPAPPTRAEVTALSMAAGNEHTCAIGTQGSVVCWGSNLAGQLGSGTLLSGSVSTILANGDYTCALSYSGGTDGTHAFECWGRIVPDGSLDSASLIDLGSSPFGAATLTGPCGIYGGPYDYACIGPPRGDGAHYQSDPDVPPTEQFVAPQLPAP